jgi:predicted DNA-binding transcriptional regulator AlpA
MHPSLIRLSDVKHRIRLSWSTSYTRTAGGKFPKSVSLGSRAVGQGPNWSQRDCITHTERCGG